MVVRFFLVGAEHGFLKTVAKEEIARKTIRKCDDIIRW